AALSRGMRPWNLWLGWDDAASPMSFMRFRWVARAVREELGGEVVYELYRPGHFYDVVVFLKSMGDRCVELAGLLQGQGTRVVFEANVDYYSASGGVGRFDAMVPTKEQRASAVAMTELADGVIASSRHLAGVCGEFNDRVSWVPDNVDFRLVPKPRAARGREDGRLNLWWSGMASKLCEFLVIERVLLERRDRVFLNLVTGSLAAMREWPPEVRERMEGLLAEVPHSVVKFTSVKDLLRRYAEGGVIVSPRFLDAPYNLSHTEWKISLGMACGLPAVASPVPSYADVEGRAGGGAVTLCEAEADWGMALDELAAAGSTDLAERGAAASQVVRKFYATPVVAREHWAAVSGVLEGGGE
ncbi:MAG: hypothetical protein WA771_15210, partial [Chthoniobacterales bacterium]